MSKFSGLALAVDKPARVILLHPVTGQPIRRTDTGEEAWIDVLSADSKPARDHEREMQNRRLRSRARRISAEEIEAEGVELLVALTKGWSLATLEGDPLDVPFSAEAARELYSSPELAFIRRQVNEAAADAGNFQAPTTSPS